MLRPAPRPTLCSKRPGRRPSTGRSKDHSGAGGCGCARSRAVRFSARLCKTCRVPPVLWCTVYTHVVHAVYCAHILHKRAVHRVTHHDFLYFGAAIGSSATRFLIAFPTCRVGGGKYLTGPPRDSDSPLAHRARGRACTCDATHVAWERSTRSVVGPRSRGASNTSPLRSAARLSATCIRRRRPVKDAACPISTRGGTRRVRLVRGGGGGGGGASAGTRCAGGRAAGLVSGLLAQASSAGRVGARPPPVHRTRRPGARWRGRCWQTSERSRSRVRLRAQPRRGGWPGRPAARRSRPGAGGCARGAASAGAPCGRRCGGCRARVGTRASCHWRFQGPGRRCWRRRRRAAARGTRRPRASGSWQQTGSVAQSWSR